MCICFICSNWKEIEKYAGSVDVDKRNGYDVCINLCPLDAIRPLHSEQRYSI